MIKSVHDYQIDDVFKKDASFFYVIPKYQREYTWSTQHQKDLYDDISENDLGYFIGSIICIDNAVDAFESTPLEVVDDQQRLTTLSILLAAIYVKLRQYKDQLDEDDEDELPTLRKSLRCSNAPHELILNKVVVCPICGEKTWLRIQDGGYLSAYPIRVNCMNCRALLRGMYIMADGIGPRGLTMYNAAIEECETNPHVSESKTVDDKEKVVMNAMYVAEISGELWLLRRRVLCLFSSNSPEAWNRNMH